MKNILLFALGAAAWPALVTAAPPESFKNLAGAPEEMPAMRLQNPENTGIRSKSAMLPVRLSEGKWSTSVSIESTEDLRITLLAPDSPTWQVKVVRDGQATNLRRDRVLFEHRQGEVGLDGVKYPAEVFAFANPKAGEWRVEIEAPASAKRDGETAGFLVVTQNSPYQVYSFVDTNETLTGREFRLRTRAFDNRTRAVVEDAISHATAEIGLTNGKQDRVDLVREKDGSYSIGYTPKVAGEYTAQITVRGTNPAGENFIRTSELLFRVVDSSVAFGRAAEASTIDDLRMQVRLPVNGLKKGQKVLAYAEVWGVNASSLKTPVAWIGGMSVVEGDQLPLILDARWLSRSDAKSGYELRNVRLQDPDYFVPLATTDTLALRIPSLPFAARSAGPNITDDMRMGKRPVGQDLDAVGGKLMLVHGYCSGSNPFPASQFANNVVFLDANKSRTHDQFANLIKTFGASLPSYGIVCHSQGGCASLHLYTYYWSGLDNATGGSRLIQSVGTPYQGTALAGNLAALGSVFGAGCGSNANLTYSGAASWMAGIPSWARAKVHYATTSFNDGWGYDYCNIATDLFLGDPDDGVVEKAYAQLPGANNRGHKTGWCHTSGMRDPAQTSDASRNADMSVNASR